LSGFNIVNLPQLDFIDLSGNLLLSLPSNLFKNSLSLQRVDLSNNRFGQIPNAALSESSLARLSWLNLTGNPLQKIYLNNIPSEASLKYPHLKELHISHTNLSILTSKDFEIFPALQNLYLVHNRINRVSPGAFVALSNLQLLDISVNEIEILPKERLQGLKMLQTLNISTNSIKELDEFASDLAKLKILDVSFNQLERIGKNIFKNLANLNEMYLNGNRIIQIASDSFKMLKHLIVLDLRKNYFENIPLRALKPLETHLKSLRIEGGCLNINIEAMEIKVDLPFAGPDTTQFSKRKFYI
jgi:Leucine-rich repeat (LRR) protein